MKPKILAAARKLIAQGTTASALDEAALTRTGVCSGEEFRAAFPDLGVFQRELTGHLFSEAREAVIKATTGLQPGGDQIRTAFVTYLDYNLSAPALQELAHLIQREPQGWDLLARMETGVALVAQADLEAMKARQPAARARLLTALCVSVVRAEYKAKRPLGELRDVLIDFCRLSENPR